MCVLSKIKTMLHIHSVHLQILPIEELFWFMKVDVYIPGLNSIDVTTFVSNIQDTFNKATFLYRYLM